MCPPKSVSYIVHGKSGFASSPSKKIKQSKNEEKLQITPLP